MRQLWWNRVCGCPAGFFGAFSSLGAAVAPPSSCDPARMQTFQSVFHSSETWVFSEALLRELSPAGGDDWDVTDTRHNPATNTLTVVLAAGPLWFSRQACPHCGSRGNSGPVTTEATATAAPGKPQTWRHLDGWSAKTAIECTLPRLRCAKCDGAFQAKPPWQGTSRHYTKSFEKFAFRVMQETTVRGASRLLCESDQRLWRMLYAHVENAGGELSKTAVGILHREWNRAVSGTSSTAAP